MWQFQLMDLCKSNSFKMFPTVFLVEKDRGSFHCKYTLGKKILFNGYVNSPMPMKLGTIVEIFEGKKLCVRISDRDYRVVKYKDLRSRSWRTLDEVGSGKSFHQRDRSSFRRKRKRVLEESEVCFYCGKPETKDKPFTLEHLVSLSEGGTDDESNLAAAHYECNLNKKAMYGSLKKQ